MLFVNMVELEVVLSAFM